MTQAFVTFLGQTPEVSKEEAASLLEHIDTFEQPDAYPNRASTIDSPDADTVNGAFLAYGDTVPSELDVRTARPHLFHAYYDDGRVHVQFRTTREAFEDFLDAVEHCLDVTDLHVGAKDHRKHNFDIQFRTEADVKLDELSIPTDWLVRTHDYEDRDERLIRLTLLEQLNLTESTDELTDRLAEVQDLIIDLTTTDEPTPDRSSPESVLEAFYTMSDRADLETQRQLQSFVSKLAHPAGIFAHVDNISPTDETVLDVDVEITDDQPNEEELAAWIDGRSQLRMVADETTSARLADSESVIVEAAVRVETNGEHRVETKEHLLAVVDGAWALVR